MTLDLAVRGCEALLGLAVAQQSLEHLATDPRLRPLNLGRLALALLLAAGIAPMWCGGLLLLATLAMLERLHGPYNGGSDRMSLLLMAGLVATHGLPPGRAREAALGYVAVQVVASYALAGGIKLANPQWRDGRALRGILAASAYPTRAFMRGWARHTRLLALASWLLLAFELLFPLALLDRRLLGLGLAAAAAFHVANALALGLNRFVWTWLAAYPALWWLQERAFGAPR